MLLLSSADFFPKKNSGTPSECHIVWIKNRAYVLSVLIWVQTVCIGYKQMEKVAVLILLLKEFYEKINVEISQQTTT